MVQFPFCTPPWFFSEVVISQDFCSGPCWFTYMRRREQTICLFSKGNEDVAVFLLRNGAFFCSYILMDSPESSKHLLRKYFIETSPLPGSAPTKTVSSHLSVWRNVLWKEHHFNNLYLSAYHVAGDSSQLRSSWFSTHLENKPWKCFHASAELQGVKHEAFKWCHCARCCAWYLPLCHFNISMWIRLTLWKGIFGFCSKS